ncbi:AsmA family protein [Pseudomonas syringae pv. pisi str. 1704B]|uniref:AsmA family protein n=1 Tax=Pseudomonas syringae pv. pisi str. 1704B TaxID=629263 RepID=F3G6H6_PSESJ|nr:AsmA family protein [Pseudomonas syringae pv. pisi str. 1704B]
MKAFGKILGLFILGLLMIIVALGFALTHLFDPNDYKDEIRQLARDKANVELTLKAISAGACFRGSAWNCTTPMSPP